MVRVSGFTQGGCEGDCEGGDVGTCEGADKRAVSGGRWLIEALRGKSERPARERGLRGRGRAPSNSSVITDQGFLRMGEVRLQCQIFTRSLQGINRKMYDSTMFVRF